MLLDCTTPVHTELLAFLGRFAQQPVVASTLSGCPSAHPGRCNSPLMNSCQLLAGAKSLSNQEQAGFGQTTSVSSPVTSGDCMLTQFGGQMQTDLEQASCLCLHCTLHPSEEEEQRGKRG